MFIILLGFIIIKLQTSVSQTPPDHMDFQKVGEAIFNNEKFNILKPTTHVISDFFKEFMLRQDKKKDDFPTKRIFIDHNGLRHYWTGFGEKSKSLRKTDSIKNELIEYTEYAKKEESSHKNQSVNKLLVVNNEIGENEAKYFSESIEIVGESADEKDTEADNPEVKLFKVREFQPPNTTDSQNKNLRGGGKTSKAAAKTTKAPAKTSNSTKAVTTTKKSDATKTTAKPKKSETTKSEDVKQKTERTVATTTFFCPFFGVITMSAFID